MPKPRNPLARALRHPLYHQRVVPGRRPEPPDIDPEDLESREEDPIREREDLGRRPPGG